MSTDLRDRIDTSFGDGPAHRPVEARVEAGRRALRRRRMLTTGAAAATVLVAATAPLAVAQLHHPGERLPVTRPAPHVPKKSAGSIPTGGTTIAPGHTYAENPITRADSPVHFDGDRLVAEDGATITARIADPPTSSSAVPDRCTARAAAVTDGPTDLFVLGYTCPHGAWDLFTETAGSRAATLPAWLDAVKAAQDGGEGVR
jgi:hypothetical protein